MASDTPNLQTKEGREEASLDLAFTLANKYWDIFFDDTKKNDEDELRQLIHKVCLYAKEYHIAQVAGDAVREFSSCFLASSNVDNLIKGSKWQTLKILLDTTRKISFNTSETDDETLETDDETLETDDKNKTPELDDNTRRRIVEAAMRSVQSLGSILNSDQRETVEEWQEQTLNNAELVLCHCVDDQLEAVVELLVEQNLWKPLSGILGDTDRVIPEHLRTFCVESAMRYTSQKDLSEYASACNVLRLCTETQLKSVLTHLVENCVWRHVYLMLRSKYRCIPEDLRVFCVERAKQYTSLMHVFEPGPAFDVLLQCTHAQVESVVTYLTYRQCWSTAEKFFKRCAQLFTARNMESTNNDIREWMVKKACEVAEDGSVAKKILPLCSDRQLDMVIAALVAWKHWEVLDTILTTRDITEHQQHLIMQAAVDEIIVDEFQAGCVYTFDVATRNRFSG
jgi:hypothetical protein